MTIAHWWKPRWHARRAPSSVCCASTRSWSGIWSSAWCGTRRTPANSVRRCFCASTRSSSNIESSLATWIGRIAFSVATRHLQRKRLPLDESFAGDDDDDGLEQISDGFDLAEAFADAELMTCVAQELDALPPMQRALISLYHLDELGIGEIASITGQPEGTVKNSLFRARRRLRERLEQAMGVHA